MHVRGVSHSLASSQAANESLRESLDHSHSLWSGKDFSLIEMSLTQFHAVLLPRSQCPDILPAWLGGCPIVLMFLPPVACRHSPQQLIALCLASLGSHRLPAPGLPCCCRRPRHRGTHYLSRHTEFRSDVWGHGQVGREGGLLLHGWRSTQCRCFCSYFFIWPPL